MFRRKTDQVYSTLQQVQRRITEQTSPGEPLRPAKPAASPALYPFAPAQPAAPGQPVRREPAPPSPLNQPTPLPFDAPEEPAASAPPAPAAQPQQQTLPQVQAAAPNLAGPLHPPAQRHALLQLSTEMTTLLVVLWMATVAIAFYAGGRLHGGGADAMNPGQGYIPGPPGHRAVGDKPSETQQQPRAQRLGDWVLLLQRAEHSPTREAELRQQAERLNQGAIASKSNPWFAVRTTPAGALELVYGFVEGQFGIDQRKFPELVQHARKSGYADARWIPVVEK